MNGRCRRDPSIGDDEALGLGGEDGPRCRDCGHGLRLRLGFDWGLRLRLRLGLGFGFGFGLRHSVLVRDDRHLYGSCASDSLGYLGHPGREASRQHGLEDVVDRHVLGGKDGHEAIGVARLDPEHTWDVAEPRHELLLTRVASHAVRPQANYHLGLVGLHFIHLGRTPVTLSTTRAG